MNRIFINLNSKWEREEYEGKKWKMYEEYEYCDTIFDFIWDTTDVEIVYFM